MADRSLARAPALARPVHAPTAASAAASATDSGATGSDAAAALDSEPWLISWARGGSTGLGVGGGDFEAARAAAREAEENYSRAGNPNGALAAKRTEMSLRGDEVMVSIAPLLQKRYHRRCTRP